MRNTHSENGNRWARRSAACVIALAAWFGCLAPVDSHAAELVIATTRSPLSLLLHFAEAQGLFSAEGVAVRTVECMDGQRCLDRLFDKSAQFAAVTEMTVVLNSFQRSDYAIVSTIGRTSSSVKLVGRRSLGIRTPADLLGKRIGVLKGSNSQYFLDAFLLFYGIDPQRVQVVDIDPTKAAEAFSSRQIDALAAYQSRLPVVIKALGNDGIVLEDPGIFTTTVNLVVDRGLLADRHGDIVKVLRALEQAQQLVAQQPERAKAVMQARLRDPANADRYLQTADFRLGIDQSLLSTMASMARWAVRQGHVERTKKVPNYLHFVESSPLRSAVPSALPL